MNLFCFTLEGSSESIYEPPHHTQGTREALPRRGYSPAPLRPTPGWGGSDPCISSIHHSPTEQKRNNRRSHTPLSALDHIDIEGGDGNAVELVSGVTDRDLPTQAAQRDLLRTAEPHRTHKRFHRSLLAKKASQSEAGRGRSEPESDDWKTHAAPAPDSPHTSCMGLARKSGKRSPPLPGRRRQGKHKNGGARSAGDTRDAEEEEEDDDDEGDGGGGLWSGGPHCHYWSPGGLPQVCTAASHHSPQPRGARPPEPWDHVCRGALVPRTSPWDPGEGAAGGPKSRQSRGSPPSPAPPPARDEEDAAEFTSEEPEKGDRSRDEAGRGQEFTEGQRRRTSISSESLYSLNSGQSSSSGVTSGSPCSSNRNSLRVEEDLLRPRRFCARARVHTDFVPSPYDTESLRLKVGDVIDVIAKPTMGIWRGMLNGKIGSFKFVYVDVLEDRESERCQGHRPCSKSRPSTLDELLKRHGLGECSNILRLHGYRATEDLARLRESHLAELSGIGPDKRRRLLAAAESLREPQCGGESRQGSETPAESSAVDHRRTRPRDSGCHMPSDCSDNGRDDSEINFQNICPPTLDQISAV